MPRPILISIIAAMGRNRVIGAGNRLPWRLPADLHWFRETTLGKPLLMGRRTYESIGRALPERLNIVVTRTPDYVAEGCTVVHSIEDALEAAGDYAEAMVIGGASLYEELLPRARRMYLTVIDANFEGDTVFPPFAPGAWREVERHDHPADEKNPYPYSFIVLDRR